MIDGSASIVRTSNDEIKITLYDDDAVIEFAKATLSLESFALAITGLSHVKCGIDIHGLDKVGTIMESKHHVFELPCECYDENRVWHAIEEAKKTCPEGWVPDTYFGSQNSFFMSGDKSMARCVIRRYVERFQFIGESQYDELLKQLDTTSNTGLDLSPGDQLCAKAAIAIRELLCGVGR